jgi:U4/U6.U5 tri-snRNP-associated protein 1
MAASKDEVVLSIEETNKLRAELGLKPLKLESAPPKKEVDVDEINSRRADEQKATAVAETIKQFWWMLSLVYADRMREKRSLEGAFGSKSIADEVDDDDALSWVAKSRREQEKKLAQQKALAAKRARKFAEEDESTFYSNSSAAVVLL